MARFLGLGSGKDGTIALGSYTQVNVTCSGTSGSTSLTATGTFSAGDRLFIIQSRGTGVGAYEDNRVASYSTGTITLVHPLENTYTDSGASQAQVVVVPEATNVTGSYTVSAWDGDKGGLFVMACTGTFAGTVNADGKGYRGGAGGPTGTPNQAYCGEGTTGASAQQQTANGNGGGGGKRTASGGGIDSGGGAGGSNASGATAGSNSDSNPTGGAVSLEVGQADLSTGIFFGGGGGGGAENSDSVSKTASGKNGGGIIIVYAGTVSSSASLSSDGIANDEAERDSNQDGDGGPGAGGTVLIKARTISSPTITASKGTRSTFNCIGWAGLASDGRIRVEACSITGTTSPTASESEGGFSYCGGGNFLL